MWKKESKKEPVDISKKQIKKIGKRMPFQSLVLLILGIGFSITVYTNCSGYLSAKHSSLSDLGSLANINHFAASDGEIIGHVERLVDQGSDLIVSGWACVVGSSSSDTLEIGASDGEYLGSTTANIPREDAVKTICNSSTSSHGFSFSISKDARNRNSGKTVYAKLGGSTIPQESGMVITAVSEQPVTPTVVGYLDAPTYRADGGLTAAGWACATGRDDQLTVTLTVNGNATSFTGVANIARGAAVQSACGSSSSEHGFSIDIPASNLLSLYTSNDVLGAVASYGSSSSGLQGQFPLVVQSHSLPYTDSLAPWTGPGGSTWNHRVTLRSAGADSPASFSIYSSSTNSLLNPSFVEQSRDISVSFSGGCYEVGTETRRSLTTGHVFEVHVRACFERKDANGYAWDITFDHAAVNLTLAAQGESSDPVYGASHGTLQLRALVTN